MGFLKAALTIIVLLIISGFVLSSWINDFTEEHKVSDGKNQNTPPIAGNTINEPSYSVSAHEIIEEYDNNEIAADKKYKGKYITISGKIESIGKDILNDPFAILESGNYNWNGIQCMFKDENDLIPFSKGNDIVVRCKVSGKSLGSVLVRECIIDQNWITLKEERETNSEIYAKIRLIGAVSKGLPPVYKTKKEWDQNCENWRILDNCMDENGCWDEYYCHEISITNSDDFDWHNVEILINGNYLIQLSRFDDKYFPNKPKLEPGEKIAFGSTIHSCKYLPDESSKKRCDNTYPSGLYKSSNPHNYNLERYDQKLCDCASFTFALANESIHTVKITADEGSKTEYFK